MEDAIYRDVDPDPVLWDHHHIIPTSWGGPSTPANLITVSPNTHRRIHVGLDACVAAGSPDAVPSEVRRMLGKAWPYVVLGWNGADPNKRKRTL